MIRITYRGEEASITVGRDSPAYVYGGRDLPEDLQGFPAFILDTRGLGVDGSGSVYRDGSINYTFGGGTDGRDIISRPVSPIGELAYTPATINVSDEEIENIDGSKTKTRSTEFDLAGTMRRMTGETALEIELGTESLGNLVPGSDFNIGEKVLLSIWGREIEVIVSGYSYTPNGWTATVQTEDQLKDFEAQKRILSHTTFWEEIEGVREELRGIQDDSAYMEDGVAGGGSGVIRVEKGSDGKFTVSYADGTEEMYGADVSDISLDGSELVIKKGEEEFKRIPLPSGGGGSGDMTEEHVLTAIRHLSKESHPTALGQFSGGIAQRNGEATPTLTGSQGTGIKANDFTIPIRGYSGFPGYVPQMIKAAPYSVVALIRAWKGSANSPEEKMDPENTAFFMVKMEKVVESDRVAHYSLKRHGYGGSTGPADWWSTNAIARIAPHENEENNSNPKRMRILGADDSAWLGDVDVTIIPTSVYPDDRTGFYPNPRDFLGEVASWLFP